MLMLIISSSSVKHGGMMSVPHRDKILIGTYGAIYVSVLKLFPLSLLPSVKFIVKQFDRMNNACEKDEDDLVERAL